MDLNMEDLHSGGRQQPARLALINFHFYSPNMDLNMEVDSDNKNEDVDVGGYSKVDNVTSETRGRKRKKILDSPKTGGGESGLRRSARRQAILAAERRDLTPVKYDVSPVISVVSEDQREDQPAISDSEELQESGVVPTKLEFPPSTGDLNLDGLPVLDLFAVYAFLRSFSTILFLSPFELRDFVESVRSNSPTLLFDSIHVTLLRILRNRLEFQSSEDSASAANCLRDLNWDLLDLITWPIYMAEYLLMKPEFDLALLKSFKTDYHKQSEFVKVELLQYICDDVIEIEAISLELNKRIMVGQPANAVDPDLRTKSPASKRKRKKPASSGMSDEVIDSIADFNSDECCLCKMDGNLICCDGCPAAYHSKCVGIATNLLPEGDWYCPECVVGKKNPEVNVAKSIRGADFLGVDPHGRSYYSSCGYLLVSDNCDAETSFHYYHMNDLTDLINALNSLKGYKTISNAITKHCRLYTKLYGEKGKLDSKNASSFVDPLLKVATESSETCMETDGPLAHSAGSSELSEVVTCTQVASKTRRKLYKSSPVVGTNIDNGNELSKLPTKKGMPQQLEIGYLNLYSFARVASSVAGNWILKPSDKVSQTPTKSLEELISIQIKIITKTSVDFCWSNIRKLSMHARKERCGWCLACRYPTDDGNCLFSMNNPIDVESFTSEVLGFDSTISRNNRFTDCMCHILYIEERLHGLLLGPWLNHHFPKIYRKSFSGASDIVTVKDLLLMLESNIWLRALSDEWQKHVDSVVTVGSASHFVAKVRMNSRNLIGKKRSTTDSEPHSLKNASTGLGLYWWRGGRLTRKLFNWKVLPRSLACKAARQGGGRKIDGILYPENSEYPKRTKALAWRASVESAVTVEQLALQIRELDANIKWEEIENTSHIAMMDKESIKSMRSFKKATIRRKSLEGASVKYLLDFGKRRFIPDAVVRNGSKIEEPSSERKKYWVEEPYVPLFLLKPFEDKRIAYKSNKMSLSGLPVSRSVVKPSKKDVYSYLLSKPEKPEKHPCGRCNKDVLISDAISCRYCEGYFHKSHARKTSGGTYTCNKCHVGHTLKASPKKGKFYSQKTKKVSKTRKKVGKGKQSVKTQANSKAFVVPLRRSARTAKIVSLQGKKKPVKKKKKYGGKKKQLTYTVNEVDKPKGKRGRPRKIRKESLKKQRTQLHAAYWLNGLHLSRNPDDERVTEFRTKNHLLPFAPLDSISQPKCSLCDERGFRSALNYINCETCREWYHGDAFGLKDEYIGALIGFKCHKCRERAPPVCPNLHSIIYEPNLSEEKNVLGTESDEQVSIEVLLRQESDTVKGQKDLLSVEASLKQINTETLPDFEHVVNGRDTQGEEAENEPDAHGDDAENGPDAQEDAENRPDAQEDVENRPDAQGEDAENGPDAQGEHVENGPSAQAENAESEGSGLDAQGGDVENGPDAQGEHVEKRPDAQADNAKNKGSGPDAQGGDLENRPDAQGEDVPNEQGLVPADALIEPCEDSASAQADNAKNKGSGPDAQGGDAENGPDAQGEHVEKGPDAQADNAENKGSGPDAQGGDVENGPDAQGEDVPNEQGLVPADALIEPCEDSASAQADNKENKGSGPDAQGGDLGNRPDAQGEDVPNEQGLVPADALIEPCEDSASAQADNAKNKGSGPDAQGGDVENGPDAQGEHVEKGLDAQADNVENKGSGPDAQGGDVENGPDAQGKDVQNKEGLVPADALIEPCEDSASRDVLFTSRNVLEESSLITHKELSIAVAQNGSIKAKESNASIVDQSKC